MKKIIAVIIFTLLPGICCPQELTQILYLGEKVTPLEEEIMLKGASCIAAFYKSISYPITVYPIRVRFYSDESDFEKYRRMHNSTVKTSTGFYAPTSGFCTPSPECKGGEIVIYKHKNYLKTFFHESNHYLLRSQAKHVPMWINEGLSDYFKELNPDCSIRALSLQNEKLLRIKEWLQNKSLENDLEQITSFSRQEWKSHHHYERDHKLYTVAWAAVFFLMSQQNGNRLIEEILQKTSARSTSEEAIDSSYPGGFQKFKTDFVRFYQEWS